VSGYVLSTDAARNLDAIWEYIAADSIDAADRWIGTLFDAFEALGQMPAMGHQRTDPPFGLVLASGRVPRSLSAEPPTD
jgi:plasmid stabilization system protein ParE